MRRRWFAVIGLFASACGTDQTVSGVFPAEGFIGRKVRVEISGDATTWSSHTSVDFGADVTVNSVSVASKTSLFADITIAPTAVPGLHDVTVHDGDAQLLSQAFDIRSPVDVTLQGVAAQGSVIFYTIRNLDLAHPFDNTRDVNGDFSNVQFGHPKGTDVSVNSVTEFQARVGLLIDLDAEAGDISMTSGIGEKALTSPLGRADIQPRTPTPLVSGVTVNVTQSEPFHSEVFSFDPAAGPAAVSATVGGRVGTSIALLGASGKFSNLIAFSSTFFDILPTTGKMFAVVLDNTGDFDYAYGLKLQTSPTLANVIPEAAAVHNTGATAQAVTLPTLFSNAAINCATIDPKTNDCAPAATDRRVMAFTVAAGDIGKRVHIMTSGTDQLTDVVVEVFTNAALTTSLGGPSPDNSIRENFASAPIPVGTVVGSKIFIVVTPSKDFSPAHTGYDAAFFLE